MKSLFRKILIFTAAMLLLVSPAAAIISTGYTPVDTDMTGELIPVTILADYRDKNLSGVIDLGTYPAELYSDMKLNANNTINKRLLSETPALCSCLVKEMDDGSLYMGRNMDLPSSVNPCFIFRIDGSADTYATVGMGYFNLVLQTFDQIVENSAVISDYYYGFPTIASDTMNEKGLVIEVNMRNECKEINCSGTNPDAEITVLESGLTLPMAMHCANIEEALAFVNSLNIQSFDNPYLNWHLAYTLMDATGRYGVMEFVNNQVVWHEGRPGYACGQTNFFWDLDARAANKCDMGFGRWDNMMRYYSDITNAEDMEAVMKHIWYSHFITNGDLVEDWETDYSSEWANETPAFVNTVILPTIQSWQEQYGIKVDEEELACVKEIGAREEAEGILWTDDFIASPESNYDLVHVHDLYVKCFSQLPDAARKESGMEQITAISYVVNNKDLTYHVHFLEQPDAFIVGIHDTQIQKADCTVEEVSEKKGADAAAAVSSPVPFAGVVMGLGVAAAAGLCLRRR
ncbi:MAG TPA: linear amide C-N hydrolase [Methanocorpusculum sp.]|nr:linear amide C-N hydrolase [Methanocorpusculum sp.]